MSSLEIDKHIEHISEGIGLTHHDDSSNLQAMNTHNEYLEQIMIAVWEIARQLATYRERMF